MTGELKIRKILAILLLVCFLVAITATAVSANQRDYERGYKEGIRDGYSDGFDKCKNPIRVYGVASHRIVGPSDYTDGYTDGYDIGFGRGQRAAGCYTNSKVLNN